MTGLRRAFKLLTYKRREPCSTEYRKFKRPFPPSLFHRPRPPTPYPPTALPLVRSPCASASPPAPLGAPPPPPRGGGRGRGPACRPAGRGQRDGKDGGPVTGRLRWLGFSEESAFSLS